MRGRERGGEREQEREKRQRTRARAQERASERQRESERMRERGGREREGLSRTIPAESPMLNLEGSDRLPIDFKDALV
jgi:hypothetical protein